MTRHWLSTIAAAALVLLPSSAMSEETRSVLAPWQAEGKIYKVGPNETQFIGIFKGIMYAESKSGDLDTAFFVCPATHVLNTQTKTTNATARCHIVTARGNIFGRFECSGEPGYCDGRFEITGGTEALAGITGHSDMQVRMALSARMTEPTSGDVIAQAEGLAVWPNLTYTIPSQ